MRKRSACASEQSSEAVRDADRGENLAGARVAHRDAWRADARGTVVLHVCRADIETRALRDRVVCTDLKARRVVMRLAHVALQSRDLDRIRGCSLDRRTRLGDAERVRRAEHRSERPRRRGPAHADTNS